MPSYKITIAYVPDKNPNVGPWCSVRLAGNASWVLTKDQGVTINSVVNPQSARVFLSIDTAEIRIEGFLDSIEIELSVETEEAKLAVSADFAQTDISTLSLKSAVDSHDCPGGVLAVDEFSLRLT